MLFKDESDAVTPGAFPGCVEPDRHADVHAEMLEGMFTSLIETGKLARALLASRNHPAAEDLHVRELLQLTSASIAPLGRIVRVTEDEWNTYAFDRWQREANQDGTAVSEFLGADSLT